MKFLLLAAACAAYFAIECAESSEKTVPCDALKPRPVHVAFGRVTVINFPFPPKEVVPGEAVFDFKQVKSDLLVKALRSAGRTNVVVYLNERRCNFDLITTRGIGDDVLIVKDAKDSTMEVKFHD